MIGLSDDFCLRNYIYVKKPLVSTSGFFVYFFSGNTITLVPSPTTLSI